MACEDLKLRLDNAIAARDRLINGEQVVIVVDAFRSRIEYKPADLDKLTAMIGLLTVEYQQCLNPGCTVDVWGRVHRNRVTLTRPITFVF